MISLLDICPLRFRMRLYPSSMGTMCRFLVNSASKFLQKSSNTQNIYVTFSVVIIAIHICKLLIFRHKVAKQWRDYQLFREFSYPELA